MSNLLPNAATKDTGQLVDASTSSHLWAEHFEGGLKDVFELEDRVTSSVVGAIAPKLEQAEIERAMRKATESLDVSDYFLRAMARWHLFTPDGLLEARQLFHRVTELDPTYAAYGVAAVCVLRGRTNGWPADLERETAEGIRLARRATAIGKDDPTALWSSALCLAYLASEIETGISLIRPRNPSERKSGDGVERERVVARVCGRARGCHRAV